MYQRKHEILVFMRLALMISNSFLLGQNKLVTGTKEGVSPSLCLITKLCMGKTDVSCAPKARDNVVNDTVLHLGN
jgi:hypothetical protein